MPLVPGDVIHSWYDYTYAHQSYQLHLSYLVSSYAGTQPTLDSLSEINGKLADTVTGGAVAEALLDCLPVECDLISVQTQRIAPLRSPYVRNAINVVGEAGSAGTGNTAATVTLFTQFTGRDQIAVKHIGPIPDAAQLEGGVTGAHQLVLNALADAMLLDITFDTSSGQCQPCIFHRSTGLTDTLVGRRITDRVGTMRRRTLRVGI